MLSAGERPQPPLTPAVVEFPMHAMPDLQPNAASSKTSSAVFSHASMKSSPIQHIWIVTGPAGCGKSTVGQVLHKELGIPFLEGDDVC